MTDRRILTIHVPMELDLFVDLAEAVGTLFPGALVRNVDGGYEMFFTEAEGEER